MSYGTKEATRNVSFQHISLIQYLHKPQNSFSFYALYHFLLKAHWVRRGGCLVWVLLFERLESFSQSRCLWNQVCHTIYIFSCLQSVMSPQQCSPRWKAMLIYYIAKKTDLSLSKYFFYQILQLSELNNDWLITVWTYLYTSKRPWRRKSTRENTWLDRKLPFYIVMFTTEAFSPRLAPAHKKARSEETMCDSPPVWKRGELYE